MDSCTPEAIQFAGRMLQKAIQVRAQLPGLIPWDISPVKTWRAPVCHDIAHAFAEVFGGTAVDGVHIFPQSFVIENGQDIVEFTTMGHAWVEFESGPARFILDVYPDEGCPVFPVLLLAPHPSYVYQSDQMQLGGRERLQGEDFRRKVSLVAEQMRKIVIPT